MNFFRSKKLFFTDSGYNPIYSIIYSDQNLTTEIIFYEEEDDFDDENEDSGFDDYEEVELPILELPGAEEFEA